MLRINPSTGHLYNIPTNTTFLESKRATLVFIIYFVRGPRSWNDLEEHFDTIIKSTEFRWIIFINHDKYEKNV